MTPLDELGEQKWELSLLLDATATEAERLLDLVYGAIASENETVAASLQRIDDLEAWIQCRCGVARFLIEEGGKPR